MIKYDNNDSKNDGRKKKRTRRRSPKIKERYRNECKGGREKVKQDGEGDSDKEEGRGRVALYTVWKSIFHRIERFALPGIFLSFTEGVPTCA